MARKLKKVEKETKTLYDLEYGEKHWKTWKIRNEHCGTWIMGTKLKNVENDTQTLYEQEYGKKNWKTWKMRKAQCKTWNMARNIVKRGKWEMDTLGSGIGQETLKNVENEKWILYDME